VVVSEIRPLVQGILSSTAAGAAASALQLMEAVSA
jgi:hypothetical protein